MKQLTLRLITALLLCGAWLRAQNPGAPAWIKPGTQIVYYMAYASVGFGTTLEPDDNAVPDENGMVWKDQNGRKYRPQEAGRNSGQAYTEVTVGHLDPQLAVLHIVNYGIEVGTGTIINPQGLGAISAPHTGSDYWMHPQLLAGMQSQPQIGVRVLRMPYTLRGKTYRAIALIAQRPTGQTAQILDLDSGVMLAYSMVSNKPNNAWAPGPGGQAQPGGGGQILSQMHLVGTRQLSLPWMAARPAQAPRLASLSYSGTHAVSMSGTPPMVLPQRVRLTAQQSGPGWAFLNEVSETGTLYNMPSVPTQGQRVTGPAMIGGLWIPPEGLALLRPGQVIDQDPITRIRHSVASVRNGQVVIESAAVQHKLHFTYDLKTGMMVGYRQQQQIGAALDDVRVSLDGVN